MVLDMIHVQCMHEEYERRLKAERLVRLALKARAERAGATAHPLGQLLRLVARLVMTPWHSNQRSIPMKHQL